MSQFAQPTELELMMLKVLWKDAPQTAREIREQLAQQGRRLAHTSVITTLQKMVDKGQLEQLAPVYRKSLRFAPRVAEDEVSQHLLGDLVNRVFNGSAEAVMLSLCDATDLDDDALRRLKRKFNQKIREST